MECFIFPKNTGRPLGMVDAVRVMLGLQTEGTAGAVLFSAFSLSVGQRVGCIKLHTGLIRISDHGNAGLISNSGCHWVAANHKIGIESAKRFDTGFVIVRIPADGLWCTEIHSSAFYRNDLPCGHTVVCIECKLICFDFHHMLIDVPVSGTVEIEVAVVCEVHNGILVRFCIITNYQAAPFPSDGNTDVQISGIAFFSIRRKARKDNGIAFLLTIPNIPVKATLAAVEMVRSIIGI